MSIVCPCGSGTNDLVLEKIEINLELKTCSGCNKGFALKSDYYCETIEQSLKSPNSVPNGWRKAAGINDLKKHKILSQVVYRMNEKPRAEYLETPFAHPNIELDDVLLLWDDGSAVGFATARSLHSERGVILDTVFIKNSHRCKGHCTSLIDIMLKGHELLCISQPTSTGMLITLLKYLKKNKDMRGRIMFIDTDGDLESVWWSALGSASERRLDLFKIIGV